MVAAAVAAPGTFTPQGCIADPPDDAGCGALQQGLDGAHDVAISPDGASAYVASEVDDALVRFDRDSASGALTPRGCVADPPDDAGCGTMQQGLDGPRGAAVSPDGISVYVASRVDHAIVRFDRDPASGALTPQGCIADVGDAAGCGPTAEGLEGAEGVAVSPDGASVYVASALDDAIVHFDRDLASGALTPQGCIADVGDTAGCGTTEEGLDRPSGVATSPDGASVYLASVSDDAIVRFDRNLAGALTGQGCIADPPDDAGCGTTQEGLNGASDAAVSPDGASVYVPSIADNAIVRFDRDMSGALTPGACIDDPPVLIGCATSAQGLDDASEVAVSPDSLDVYVSSAGDDALARFGRDLASGALTPQGCVEDPPLDAGCGATQQGLDQATVPRAGGVTVSPDSASVYVAGGLDNAIVRFGYVLPVSPPPVGSQPPNDFTFGKLKRKKKQGIAFLIAFVPGPGQVGLAGKGIKNRGLASTARKSVFTPGGRVKLKVVPTKKGKGRKIRNRLRTKGKAKLKVRVTYLPAGGVAHTRAKKVKLVLR